MRRFFALLLVAAFCFGLLQPTAFAADEKETPVDPRTYIIGTPPAQEISGAGEIAVDPGVFWQAVPENVGPPEGLITKETVAAFAAGPLREYYMDPLLEENAEQDPLLRALLPAGRSDAYRDAFYTVFLMLQAGFSLPAILDSIESVYRQSDELLFLPREADMWRFPMGTEFMAVVPHGAAKPAHDYTPDDFSPALVRGVQYLAGFVLDEDRPEDWDVLLLQPAAGCSPAAFYRMLQASPYVMLCAVPESRGVFRTERGDGDVDGNGEVSVTDARLALRQAVGLEEFAPDSGAYISADVDRNADVDVTDARTILRKAVGLE